MMQFAIQHDRFRVDMFRSRPGTYVLRINPLARGVCFVVEGDPIRVLRACVRKSPAILLGQWVGRPLTLAEVTCEYDGAYVSRPSEDPPTWRLEGADFAMDVRTTRAEIERAFARAWSDGFRHRMRVAFARAFSRFPAIRSLALSALDVRLPPRVLGAISPQTAAQVNEAP